MVCIASIAAYDSGRVERTGLRRALVTRRANLGDCPDAPSVLRRIASPRSLRHPACVVPLPRRSRGDVSTAELAVQVSRQALGRAVGLDPQAVGAVIYCHATPDARTTDSTAGRLQCDLGLRRANPFSVSQAHNTALLIALDIAAGLIEGPEAAAAVLVVAADKLLFGKPPHLARDMVWSDVAAAAVVTREARAGWRIEHVVLGHFATPCDALHRWPAADEAAFACHGAALLRRCLADQGIHAGDLSIVVAASPDAGFVRQVHRAAGLSEAAAAPGLSVPTGLRATHASCADVLLGLSDLEARTAAGQPVLAWCHGNNGEFACAVLTRIA